MYQDLPNVCYECGVKLDRNPLTKEHVPPKCFFPKTDKESLITVPSCIEHNSGKSGDDEYLFQMISIQIQANEKGQDFAVNKTVRSILRNRKLTKNLAETATQVYVDENKDGRLKPTFAFEYDAERIEKSIISICKGVYFYEFHKVFSGSIRTYNEFQFSLDNDSIERNQEFENMRNLIRRNFSNVEKKGLNQEVFYYQIMTHPRNIEADICIRLCFYGGISIIAILKKHKIFRPKLITTALKSIHYSSPRGAV